MAKRNDVAAVRWLLEHGADVNARWSHWGASATALHLAAAFGHVEVAQALLDAGADASLHDSRYDGDALAWARHFEQAATITLLESVPVRDTGPTWSSSSASATRTCATILDAFDGWIVGIQSQAGPAATRPPDPGCDLGRVGFAGRGSARTAAVRLALARGLPTALTIPGRVASGSVGTWRERS